jgi:hypothetical protein
MKKNAFFTAAALAVGLLTASAVNATPFSISMVADNDFAIFSGTQTSINSILYQNHKQWGQQISALSTLSFNLNPGDNVFYVLAMGGGGEENISGMINGVNMTSLTGNVFQSNNISAFLTGYNGVTVENGTYTATIGDVQRAFASGLNWTAPQYNTTDIVIRQSGFGSGFHFENMNAHLFKFTSQSVNVPSVPAPAGVAVLGFAVLGLALARRRNKTK